MRIVHKISVVLLLLLNVSGQAFAQNYKLGLFYSPGMAYRTFDLKAYDSTMVFSDSDKPTIGSEAGIIFLWYPEEKFHIEGGLQLGKKGFRSEMHGENKYIDYTGIEIIGDPPIVVNSKVDFYFLSASLRAGYEFYQDRSFSIGARTGFLFDVHYRTIVRQRAEYSDRTEKIVIRPDFEGLRDWNVGASLGVYINYLLSESWELSLEPYYTTCLYNSIETPQNDLRFYNVGIRASILFILNSGSNYRNPLF